MNVFDLNSLVQSTQNIIAVIIQYPISKFVNMSFKKNIFEPSYPDKLLINYTGELCFKGHNKTFFFLHFYLRFLSKNVLRLFHEICKLRGDLKIVFDIWNNFLYLDKILNIFGDSDSKKRQTTFWNCYVILGIKVNTWILHLKFIGWQLNATNHFKDQRRYSSRLSAVMFHRYRVAGYGEYIYECLIFYIDNTTRHFKELQGYQQSMKLHDDCAESILSIYLSVISLRNI